LPPLPLARRGVRAAAVGHVVYLFGGSTEDNQTVARTDAFDTETQTWSVKAPLISPVQSPGVVAIGTSIYLIGGVSNTAQLVNTVYEFDTVANAWQSLPPLRIQRSNMGIAVLGGQIYVIGGAGPDGPLDSVERYDVAKHIWSTGKPLPEPMMNIGAAAIDGKIHVLLQSTHDVYSPETDTWSSTAPMETPRHGFGTAVIGDNLYVIGGCHLELYDMAVTEVLNVRTQSPHRSPSDTVLAIIGTITTIAVVVLIGRQRAARDTRG
jgi:N-acetylneuraminic acid mutarotase